jgi:hypothetical protein
MVYLDNKEALSSWNGICLSPSLDMNGKNYRYETGKLGGPYDKFEANDVRKQNYVYYGGTKYEGMFLAGKLVNLLTGSLYGRRHPRVQDGRHYRSDLSHQELRNTRGRRYVCRGKLGHTFTEIVPYSQRCR